MLFGVQRLQRGHMHVQVQLPLQGMIVQASEASWTCTAAAFTSTSAGMLHFFMRWRIGGADAYELSRRKWLLALHLLRDPLYGTAISYDSVLSVCVADRLVVHNEVAHVGAAMVVDHMIAYPCRP